MTASDCPFTVAAAAAAAAVAEADRGPAERAEDPKRRRRPNRLAVSPQSRVISIAARTVKKETRASFCPLNELGVCVSESLCRLDSEDIYGLFRLELAMYYLAALNKMVLFYIKLKVRKEKHILCTEYGTRAD